MTLCRFAFLLTVAAGAFNADAYVNPIDQSLAITHVDIAGKTVKLSRNFNSLRAQSGAFGRGWCTIWESTLKVKNGRAEFNFCGMGRPMGFESRGPNWKSSDPSYQLVQDKSGFTMQAGYRDAYRFDREGQLIGIKVDGLDIQVHAKNGKIEQIEAGGEKFQFSYAGERVAKVEGGGFALTYTYDKDILTAVKNAKATLYSYTHNANKQLEEVKTSQPATRYKYEYKGRSVAAVTWDKCTEVIKAASNTYVEVTKTCKGSRPEKRGFAISGVSRDSGMTVKEKQNGGTFERTWKNNRLVEQKVDGSSTSFAYDNNGMLKIIKRPKWQLSVSARASGYPQRVVIADGVGRKPASETLSLKWQKGQLVGLTSPSLNLQIENGAGSTQFQGRDFKLAIKRAADGSYLSGVWDGKALEPFMIGKDLKSYSETQLQAMSAATSLAQLTSQLESL